MRIKNYLSDRKRNLLAAAALGAMITFTATVTHAGFQWVPPSVNGEPARAHSAPAPAAPAKAKKPRARATAPVENDTFLPLPDEVTAADEPAAEQTLQLPPGYEAEPAPAAPKQVMRTKQITQPAPAVEEVSTDETVPTGEPVPLLDSAPPVMQEQAAVESASEEQAPVVEDTPQEDEKIFTYSFPGRAQAPADQKVEPPAQKVVAIAEPAETPPPAPDHFDVVQGFGSDIPLALALQQIAPANYAFSFGTNVNPGQTVSWDGGRPWNEVLENMLAPLAMEAVISDRIVHIRSTGQVQGALEDEGQTKVALASPAALRRDNIRDPGEQSKTQTINMLAGIQTAAGTPDKKQVPAEMANRKPASPPRAQAVAVAEIKDPDGATEIVPLVEITPDDKVTPVVEITAPVQQQQSHPQIIPVNQWQAKAGESLRDILTRWSNRAGVELIWMASYDYKIKQDIFINDEFGRAVHTIIANGIDQTNAPIVNVKPASTSNSPDTIVIKDKV